MQGSFRSSSDSLAYHQQSFPDRIDLILVIGHIFLDNCTDFLRFLFLLIHFRQYIIQILLNGSFLTILDIVQKPSLRIIHHLRKNVRNIVKNTTTIVTAFPIFLIYGRLLLDYGWLDFITALS